MLWCTLDSTENDLIAFFEWPTVESVTPKVHGKPVRGPFVFDHIAFGMDTMEDLWALKDVLVSAGIEVSDMIDHGFICSIYAHDPNGIPIEFSVNVEGTDVRKTPVMGDAQPTAAALEGAEPQPGHWPAVETPMPRAERVVRPGAGSELFHGVKKA